MSNILGAIKQKLFTPKLFLYEENKHSYIGLGSPYVVRGSYEAVVKLLSKSEINNLVRGYVIWSKPLKPNKRMPGRAIGVFGKREVSRFKRVLRERGAVCEIIKSSGPKQDVASITRSYKVTVLRQS